MSLDVWLYQFKDVDTDVVLELSRLSEEPYSDEEFQKWKALPSSERGDSFPTKECKAAGYQKLVARADQLGFPKSRFAEPGFGGTPISFPSTRHPKWPVGEWYSFSTVRELMENFTGKNFYFVLPEAEGIHGLFRPNWAASRMRLAEILDALRKLTQKQVADFHARFVMAQIPPVFLERWKSVPRATATDIFEDCLAQIEVMIETLDFVLNSGNPREFLLYWSD